jgi:hypothetical protein
VKNKSTFDLLGITTSGLCLLHCLALPLVMASAGTMVLSPELSEFFHLGLLVIIFFFSFMAFYPNWKATGDRLILSLAAGALATLISGFVLGDVMGLKTTETALTVMGSVLLVIAHLLNMKSRVDYPSSHGC